MMLSLFCKTFQAVYAIQYIQLIYRKFEKILGGYLCDAQCIPHQKTFQAPYTIQYTQLIYKEIDPISFLN